MGYHNIQLKMTAMRNSPAKRKQGLLPLWVIQTDSQMTDSKAMHF